MISVLVEIKDLNYTHLSTAVSEQRASPGSQAGSEGTQGQSDSGSPLGTLLQCLAAFLHHQHGRGQ